MVWDGKKNICVDFDGVIHLYESGWKDLDVIEDLPHPDAFAALATYVERFHVYIYSARSAEERGIVAMKTWFLKHGLMQEVFDKLIFADKKPTASIYIDDRGWMFVGTFPTAEEIDAFKPWNKK